MENQNKYLETEKISKLLKKFAIPCILSLLISSLYNIVDQIFIGNSSLGFLGNAATTVVYPITIIAVAFAWCFGDGTAAFLSLSLGRNDTKKIDVSVGNTIVASIIISIIFVIVGFVFMDDILYAFGASDASISLAREYFKIILCGIPVYMFANSLNSVIRADGSPKMSMLSTLAGAIINIILDPIFIYGFKWGMSGAAWATVIGQIVSFIITLVYLFRTKTFKLKLNSFKMNFKVFGNVLKLGVSTFITQASIVVISLVCNIMLAKYGAQSQYGADIPIAVIGITMKVFTIVINIAVGIILGAQPILGYNYGARRFDRVKDTFKLVIKCTVIVGIVATLIFELCPEVVIRLFGTNNDLYMEFAVSTFRIFLMLVTFTCLIKVISIFFQAVGKPVKATIVSLCRDIVVFVPLVIILPRFLGVKGCLWAAPVADLVGMIVSSILVALFFRELKTLQVEDTKDVSIKGSKKGVIITISRQHGTCGKEIGRIVANTLNIPFYDKELVSISAKESGLDREFLSKMGTNADAFYNLYLSTTPGSLAISAQSMAIQKLAEQGSCVIIGRASNYVLKDNPRVVSIFLYGNIDYRIKNVMNMYDDTKEDAIKNIRKSDKNRASYYNTIASSKWDDYSNYDLCIDASIGVDETAQVIIDYIKKQGK